MVKNGNNLLLSIVIPTRNRSQYLKWCLKSILEFDSDRFEVIVHDQSDDNDFETMAARELADPRVVYAYDTTSMNHTIHFMKAVHKARGEYVILIGDDDTVHPSILKLADWAGRNDIDALSQDIRVTYNWPDLIHRWFGSRYADALFVHPIDCILSPLDLEGALVELSRNLGKGTLGLPKLYHGLIRRECLQRLYEEKGSVFFGVSPDISAAVALTSYLKKCFVTDYPFSLPGGGARSFTGRGAEKVTSIKDDPHMKGYEELEWPPEVPPFFSARTVWAEAAIEGLQVVGRTDIRNRLALPKFHSECLMSHPEQYRIIIRNYLNLRKEKAVLDPGLLRFAGNLVAAGLRHAFLIAKRIARPAPAPGSMRMAGGGNIQEASRALQAYLARTGRETRLDALLIRKVE